MSDFKLKFTLKQHTPIIHFQHDQAGATLRATEVKAKLDKYLIGKLTGEYGDENERLKAMMRQDEHRIYLHSRPEKLKSEDEKTTAKPALDYRMRVEIVQLYPSAFLPKTKEPEQGFPCFFGNMGDHKQMNEHKKSNHFTFHQLVKVTIHSTNTNLLEVIQNNFPDFLMRTNFGMRQSKGFGSYFLLKQDLPPDFNVDLEYAFDVDVSTIMDEYARQKELFRVIDVFYKSIRSGINICWGNEDKQLYVKSLLWRYLKEKKAAQWDKRTIKQFFYPHIQTKHEIKHPNDLSSPVLWDKNGINLKTLREDLSKPTHFLWRDLLGLAAESAWKKEYEDNLHKEFYKRDPDDTKSAIFSRIPSPILFKPLRLSEGRFRVFFEVPKHLKASYNAPASHQLGQTAFLGEMVNLHFDKISRELLIPFPEEFNFDAFFTHAFSVDLEDYVKKGKKHDDFAILKNIYAQLKPRATDGNTK